MFQLTIGEKAPKPFAWLHYLAELATALMPLTWPLVVVALALIFRKPVGNLISRIRSARGPGGFEANMDEKIDELQASVASANTASLSVKEGVPVLAMDAASSSLASVHSPTEVILDAWHKVEAAFAAFPGR